MFEFVEKIKAKLEGDKSVQLVANDPALTAELLLLFRVMLADGVVKESELAAFKNICKTAFGMDPEHMDGVYTYLEDYAYEITAKQATEMFQQQPQERKQALMDHMIAIAQADFSLHQNELHVLKRTSAMLGFELKTD